ncbi:MAG TPA: flavodoxin family protein [Thermodesulfobacteriota bacterium]|nr:flavodoxin family protein [Thermodesulfobacteriota bacterium]
MRVVALNGSARKDGNTAILLNLVLDELQAEKIETEMIQLAGEKISGCIACYKCQKNKDGKCVVKADRANEYIRKMREAEGILLGSPTYVADITANLKAILERATIVCRANGGEMLKRKPGAGIVAVRRAGAIQAINVLNAFFLINQMIVVGSSYWNVGIGRNLGEVNSDLEGIQTMKALGQNMAWLLKKIHG